MTLPLAALLQGAVAGGPTGQTYVDDVFSTYLYTGNGSTQTINNGIDLAGKGGMVWNKARGGTAGTEAHRLVDTVRGAGKSLQSNATLASDDYDTGGISSFSGSGFSLGNYTAYNASSTTYASWTFRKAPKFFDMVAFTGDGTTNGSKSVSHSLGVMPGMVIIKRTDGVGDWAVAHRNAPSNGTSGSLAGPYNYGGQLNTTAAFSNLSEVYSASATDIKVIDANGGNINGATYVAYLFAHDTSTDGIIQCGSYTGNGSATGPTITLGWEPQYVMIKKATASGTDRAWWVFDSMRGVPVGAGDNALSPNSAGAESTGWNFLNPTATGFNITTTDDNFNTSGIAYIYLAIRRPNKPPTSGTQVYNAIAYTANNTDGRKLSGIGFPPDLVSIDPRSSYTTPGGPHWFSRLTGNGRFLTTASTSAELDGSSNSNGILGQDDFTVSRNGTNVWSNVGSYLYILHAFRRAPGVFDETIPISTSTGSVANPHNLGVAPELVIFKARSAVQDWFVESPFIGVIGTYQCYLNLTNSRAAAAFVTNLSATTFTTSGLNPSAYVFYLFASKAGISKVGSYTGNGTSQTINCGFSTGARFVLIKRTDAAGDWFVWDSTRGIVAGNDPHLSLNTTAAEVTTDDSIDPDNSGFIVNQIAATNINVSSASYIFLALS